jgi:hypothetical protein
MNLFENIIVHLPMSDEADTGSGGDRPARNNLIGKNGTGGTKLPQSHFLFLPFMPKKTLCFGRSKSEKTTFINPKKGQHREGQDTAQ